MIDQPLVRAPRQRDDDIVDLARTNIINEVLHRAKHRIAVYVTTNAGAAVIKNANDSLQGASCRRRRETRCWA